MYYVGMGAPVTHDVIGHRALEKQQNYNIMVSLEFLKHGLQMNFSPIRKIIKIY